MAWAARYATHARREKQREYNRRHYLKRKREQAGMDEKKVLLSVRIPEWMVAKLQRLWAEGLVTGKYPCRNMSEAVQWVLRCGFISLRNDPIIGEAMKYAEAEREITSIARIRKEGMSLLHKASEEVSALLSIDEHEHAYSYFRKAVAAIESLQATVWSRAALTKFREKYPDLAKMEKKKIVPKTKFTTDPDAHRSL